MAVTLAELGFEIDARPIEKAAAALDKLPAAGGRAEAAAKSLGNAARGAANDVDNAAEAAEKLARRAEALKTSIDPLYAAQARLDRELAEAKALFGANAISAAEYAKAQEVLGGRLSVIHAQQAKVSKGMKLTGAEAMNLGRQFTDVGVQLAMGMNPLMILIQQGPQIADIFGMAAARGVGLKEALAGILGPAAGVAAALAPIIGLAAAAAGGFALMHRELSKGIPDDLTQGMGLTEKQLERVKDRTVTMGDTFKATLQVMGKYLTSGPLGEALDWLGEKWNGLLDWMTNAAFEGTARIYGLFVGSARAIAGTWKSFPAVLGDAFAMAVNAAIDAVEALVNTSVLGLNRLFDALRILPQFSWLPKIPKADLDGFKMKVSGAAGFVVQAIDAAIETATEEARRGMRKLGAEIRDGAKKIRRDIILDQAGDAPKEAADKVKKAAGVQVEAWKEVSANLDDFRMKARDAGGEVKHMTDLITVDTENLRGKFEFESDRMVASLNKVTDAVGGILSALKSGDWGGALSKLGGVFEGLAKKFSGQGGFLSVLGSGLGGIGAAMSAGQALGLGTGNAGVDLGLGLAGGLGGMAFAGSSLVTGGAFGSAIGTALGGTALGAGAATALSSPAVLVPIGVLAALALGGLFGSKKPSNNGAIATITGDTYALSGSKRNDQTSKMADAAAQAIIAGQKALQAAGASLGVTITGIDIGTRDLTHIFTSAGDELRSKVGDPADAASVALDAVLKGAKFTDEAAQKLVDSMTAAGAGFDDVIAALGSLKEAMAEAAAFGQSIADRIEELKNPAGFSVTSLARSQDARYAQLDAYLAGGAVTKAEYDRQKAQLGELDSLELNGLMKDLAGQLADLTGATDAASAANDNAAQAAQATAAQFANLAKSLRDYQGSLSVSAAGALSPLAAFRQASAAFGAIQGKRDPASLEALRATSQAYIDAAAKVAPDARTLARVMAKVQAEVGAAADYAEEQASIAEQSLSQLSDINKFGAKDATVQGVVAAIGQLGTIITARQINSGGGAFTAAPDWFNASQYIADNKDLRRNWEAGGSLTTLGGTLEEAARKHFLMTGQFEIAAGTRKYAAGTDSAAGGWSLVGERGPELVRLSRGAQVVPNATLSRMADGSNDNAALVAAIREQNRLLAKIAADGETQKNLLRSVTRDGQSLVTVAA